MIRLDSLKLVGSIDSVRGLDIDRFCHQKTKAGGSDYLTRDSLVAKDGDQYYKEGLKQVEVDQLNGLVKLELSAKILDDQYYDLINLNTIDRVIDQINRTGIIQLDGSFIDSAGCHRVDATNNIDIRSLGLDQASIQRALLSSAIGTGYDVEVPKKSLTSIFSKGSTGKKTRQIFYYKDIELKTAKYKKWRGEVGQSVFNKIVSDHKNQIRCESNWTKFEGMRLAFFNTGYKLEGGSKLLIPDPEDKRNRVDGHYITPKLIDILQSTKPVNYDLFKKITTPSQQMELFRRTLNECIQIMRRGSDGKYKINYTETVGIRGILDMAGWDMDQVKIQMNTVATELDMSYRQKDYIIKKVKAYHSASIKVGVSDETMQKVIDHISYQLKVA